jgi:hypothetical protein
VRLSFSFFIKLNLSDNRSLSRFFRIRLKSSTNQISSCCFSNKSLSRNLAVQNGGKAETTLMHQTETDSEWTFATATSKATAEMNDLTPVTKYWFRVAAVTAQGTSAYNDPIMQIVS